MTYLRAMRPEDLLLPTPAGVCCKLGGFHIDPTRPVDKAMITHGHSDHARAGHGAVLATQETLDLMRLRYGETYALSTQAVRYGETVTLGGEQRCLIAAPLDRARDLLDAWPNSNTGTWTDLHTAT